jgi:uncharacterized protein YecT (DUF1311 family)
MTLGTIWLQLLTALALVLAVVAPSLAEPSDPVPSADFAGVWRIVDARAAPWATQRRLTKADAPLLEYAIEFANGAVKGPAALACKNAQYHDTISYAGEVFGGRLAKGSEASLAEKMGLEMPEIGTVRTSCSNGRFEYYLARSGDLMIALGDIIYTLERPQGMDSASVTAGYAGPSFDCTKAKTAGDKLICTDSRLARADRKLGAAYARLRKTETAESFATVQAAQRGWLGYVIPLCGAQKPLPEFVGDQNPIRDCLDENYNDRADRFADAVIARAGPLILEPRIRFFARARPSTEDSDIYPWMEGGSEAAPFNAFIAKALAPGRPRMDDKELFAFDADQIPVTMSLYARRTYSVIRFDRRIASLLVSTYDFTGGAHEVLGEHAITWDMVKGRPRTFDDVFAPRTKWREFVTAFCAKDLKGQFDEGAPPPDAAAVHSVTADIGNWMFDSDAAVVHFTVYTVASFAGGEYDVKIPYRLLAAYLKPGVVL